VSHPPGQEVTGIMFNVPRSIDGGTFVVMGYQFPADQDVQLTAVDMDGKHHVGQADSSTGMLGVPT
jgi:hypothetical protein